jgi:hypothetical protein
MFNHLVTQYMIEEDCHTDCNATNNWLLLLGTFRVLGRDLPFGELEDLLIDFWERQILPGCNAEAPLKD